MSRKEKEVKEKEKPIYQLKKIASSLDESLAAILPPDLAESAEHLINARIEFLTAVNKFIETRITRLEKEKSKIKEKAAKAKPIKEKVPVE